jgi:TFIIF-interacting CTD phosphatase-like protein
VITQILKDIRVDMLHVKQAKTLATVVVPLRKEAKEILIDKYRMQMPQVSNPNLNYYIREVVRLAGINEMVKITHKHGNKVNDHKTQVCLDYVTYLQKIILHQ